MVDINKVQYVANQIIEVIKIARAEGISDLEIGAGGGLALPKIAGSVENIDTIIDFAKRHS